MTSRVLKLRRPDVCVGCGTSLEGGEEAWWDAIAKTVTCLACQQRDEALEEIDTSELDRGHAGASAGREYDRRKTNRETRVRNVTRTSAGCCCG